MTRIFLTWLACTGGESEDPLEVCQSDPDTECCVDADCGEEQFCWHTWQCATIGGEQSCDPGIGDRTCHDLCSLEDSVAPDQCPTFQDCQAYEHAQGESFMTGIAGCF